LLGLHVGSTDDDISNSMSDSKDKGYVDYYYVRSTSVRCYVPGARTIAIGISLGHDHS
jgi:hypothetical protein